MVTIITSLLYQFLFLIVIILVLAGNFFITTGKITLGKYVLTFILKVFNLGEIKKTNEVYEPVLYKWNINQGAITVAHIRYNGYGSIKYVISIFVLIIVITYTFLLFFLPFSFDFLSPSRIIGSLIVAVTCTLIMIGWYKILPHLKAWKIGNYRFFTITQKGIYESWATNQIIVPERILVNIFNSFTELGSPKFYDKTNMVKFNKKNRRFIHYYIYCTPENYQQITTFIKGLYPNATSLSV